MDPLMVRHKNPQHCCHTSPFRRSSSHRRRTRALMSAQLYIKRAHSLSDGNGGRTLSTASITASKNLKNGCLRWLRASMKYKRASAMLPALSSLLVRKLINHPGATTLRLYPYTILPGSRPGSLGSRKSGGIPPDP